MANKRVQSEFQILAVVLFLLAMAPGAPSCNETTGRFTIKIASINPGGLPVMDCLSRDYWEHLESGIYRNDTITPKLIDSKRYLVAAVADSARTELTVVSKSTENTTANLSQLFNRIGFIPYVPGIENVLFVDEAGDFLFVSGTAIPPLAIRQANGGGSFDQIAVARGADGRILPAGSVAGMYDVLRFDETLLHVLRMDPEGLGMLKKQRPFPSKKILIAWDSDLQQLPTLHFDELGVNDQEFWIQRSVDAFQVPASYEGPWFASSWHCPHFFYQYSLLDPLSGMPSVLLIRLYFRYDGRTLVPKTVSIDLVEAAEYSGPSAACQRFLSREQILGTRFGRYKGEGRTERSESGTGDEYLETSMSFTLNYLEALNSRITGLQQDEVSVSGRMARALGTLESERGPESPIGEKLVEIGGVSPNEYFDELR